MRMTKGRMEGKKMSVTKKNEEENLEKVKFNNRAGNNNQRMQNDEKAEINEEN